jgi:hypothetical protein
MLALCKRAFPKEVMASAGLLVVMANFFVAFCYCGNSFYS